MAQQYDSQRASILSLAALTEYGSFMDQKSDVLLDLAIDYLKQSLALTPEISPALPERCLDLAEMTRQRYERKFDPEDLIQGIQTVKKAYSSMPCNHKNFPDCAYTYAILLDHQYERSKTISLASNASNTTSLINEAVEKIEEAVTLAPNSSVFHQAHGVRLFHRYEYLEDPRDLQSAIEASQRAISSSDASREADDAKLLALSQLGSMYASLYEMTDQEGYFELAIKMAQTVESETRDGHSERPTFLGVLAKLLHDRFSYSGDRDDLDRALILGKEAIQMVAAGNPDYGKWVNNLGLAYESKFETTGDMNYLDKAIMTTEEAIAETPLNHSDLLRRTNNLANQLGRRFEWTGETKYLEQAIWKLQAVVDSNQLSVSDKSTCLNNLAYLLIRRFERERDSKNLDEAIHHTSKSLLAIPDGHANRPMLLNNLGNALRLRYEQMGDGADIDRAILIGNEVASSMLGSPKYRPTWLSNLGISFIRRFQSSDKIADLESAIKNTEEAVQLTEKEFPDRAVRINNLANMFQSRSVLLGGTGDLDEALNYYTEATESSVASPLVRVTSARNAIRLLRRKGLWEEMRSLGKKAIQLLPLVCGRYLNQQDQQHAVTQTSGLAVDVCSILLNTGHVEEAIQSLEFGRGLIIGYIFESRDEFSALTEDHPDLASQLKTLRRQIYQPVDMNASHVLETRMRERRAAIHRLETCLRQIRHCSGYRNFLMQPEVEEMKTCAEEGPIVVVNFTDISGDAILISTSEIIRVPLPEMSKTAVPEFIRQDIGLFGSSARDFRSSRDIGSEVDDESYCEESFLSWLWRTCVEVVLQKLKDIGMVSYGTDLPRIWWIGTGVASSFPFHAAESLAGSDENALSLMIPSYTPSIKALAHSRQRSREYMKARSDSAKQLLAIVTMPTTPGQKPLDGVKQERIGVENACKRIYSCVDLQHPTAEAVLDSIKQSDIVHFACHGLSHKTDPSRSHLLLQKNSECGPVVDELSVFKIYNIEKSGSAWMSYLSACSTAEVKDSSLADEGIHLSSALQIAGFAHVIGSLWSVEDNVCIRVARNFYESLVQAREGQLGNREVAMALRSAVLSAKTDLGLQPRSWASYIHSGA